jgi:hypothetical protein
MSVKKLKKYSQMVNLVDELTDEQKYEIQHKAINGYEDDLNSMSEWLSDVKKVEELASLTAGKKNVPLPNSANVKLPIITKACYEFAARVVPEILKDDQVVKTKVLGIKPTEAQKLAAIRTSDFMNWQLLLKNSEWADQLDMLMLRLALVGFICKKTYYDPVRKQIKSEICQPDELIINAKTKSLVDAKRITHKMCWRLNTLVENSNKSEDGVTVFCKEAVERIQKLKNDDPLDSDILGIEQCMYLDLDEDGYLEPYIATIATESQELLRLVAQYSETDIYADEEKVDQVCYINKEEVYEDFHFLKNPKGCFQSVGFGILLLHLTESANSTINQLLDAGQLANMKGGFMDARMNTVKKGPTNHRPGEFQLIKTSTGMTLKDGILPIDFGEPSQVLYNLLSLLIDVCRDLTSSAEINNGTQSSENAKTGATLALQEEGRKAATLINKSVYRSLGKELNHRFRLNNQYLTNQEYRNIINDTLANVKNDFNLETFDVMPTADPNLASSQQKMAEVGLLQQVGALPGVNLEKITSLIIDRINIPGIKDVLYTPEEKQSAPPSPEVLKLQADMEEAGQKLNIEGARLEIEKQKVFIQAQLAEAQILQYKANAMALLAKAGSEEQKMQLQELTSQLDIIQRGIDQEMETAKMVQEQDQIAKQQEHEKQMQMMQQQGQPPAEGAPPERGLPPEGAMPPEGQVPPEGPPE